MPAVTRSQSKKQVIQSESDFNARLKSMLPMPSKKEVQTNTKSLEATKPKPDVNSRSTNTSLFIKSITDKLFISEEHSSRYSYYKSFAEKLTDSPAKDDLIKKYKQYYFDNVRIATEIYYTIVDWFDRVFIVNGVVASPSLQRLLNVIYNKMFEHEADINDIKNPMPQDTPEEKHIVKTFMDQLREARTVVEPYVSPELKPVVVQYGSSAPKAPVVKSAPRRSARLMNRNNA
jgi:hypothetical protein